ncbi:MAG: 6-bladed beta-propeller [Gammaproteobacteria bacterium]|nr:6-bladed beta-propeller [Gammaproteobacteria bacterium]
MRLSTLVIALSLAGCSSLPHRSSPPPVFPEPPEQARFVYDGSLRASKDVEEKSFGESLQSLLTGATNDARALVKPYGVVAHRGKVYVSDTIQRAVVVFDISGKKYWLIGEEGEGSLVKPLGLDISVNDELYVADISARRIAVFDLQGGFLRALGDERSLVRPSSVNVSLDGKIAYVVDTGGIETQQHQVQLFDTQSGKLIKTLGSRGQGKDQFNLPLQATVASNGDLYVVDSGNFRIQQINPQSGQFVRQIGTLGRRPGQFSRPKGIANDAQGNIYVVDTAFGNVQIFNAQGELLMHIGERGTSGIPGRYMLPAGVDVDQDGRIYVVDQFFRKIDIYRPADLPSLPDIPKL